MSFIALFFQTFQGRELTMERVLSNLRDDVHKTELAKRVQV